MTNVVCSYNSKNGTDTKKKTLTRKGQVAHEYIDELPNLELPLSLQLSGHVQDEQTITIPYFC